MRKNQDLTKPTTTKRRTKGESVNSAAEADHRDPTTHEKFKLDIKAPGKLLGDEGAIYLFDGLEISLTICSSLALVDLDLSGNAITTRSLARLAPILGKARYDFQTLNLSNNNIQVESTEQAKEWKKFLQAFQPCVSLRRLDLSDNTSLGHLALEILARVHTRERRINPLPATGLESVESLPNIASEDNGHATPGTISRHSGSRENNMEDSEDDFGGKLEKGGILDGQHGLRSLSYITLHNVGLTDTGALFLSFVLEDHYYPIQLINDHNATSAVSSINCYSQNTRSAGIDWDRNSHTLSKDGMSLLQHAEKVRAALLAVGDGDSMTDSLSLADFDIVGHGDLKSHDEERYGRLVAD